jgi:hypothetical protein
MQRTTDMYGIFYQPICMATAKAFDPLFKNNFSIESALAKKTFKNSKTTLNPTPLPRKKCVEAIVFNV